VLLLCLQCIKEDAHSLQFVFFVTQPVKNKAFVFNFNTFCSAAIKGAILFSAKYSAISFG